MKNDNRNVVISLVLMGLLTLNRSPAMACSHTWDLNEVFSNADGTIQFIELKEVVGLSTEWHMAGLLIRSNTNTFTFPSDLIPPTTNKFLLLATAGFAALPGAPTPDYIIVDNFFSPEADRLSYHFFDIFEFFPGQLPIDGINSLRRDRTTGQNSPINYEGVRGTVDASPPPIPTVSLRGMGALCVTLACTGAWIARRRASTQ